MNREALRLYLVTNRYQDSLESFLEKWRQPAVQALPSSNYEKKSHHQPILSAGKTSQGNNRRLSGALDYR